MCRVLVREVQTSRAAADYSGVPLCVGELRRHRLLGITALYRVVDPTGPNVTVEALRVPGIAPGTTIRLTHEAVGAMEAISEAKPLDQELEATLRRWARRAA